MALKAPSLGSLSNSYAQTLRLSIGPPRSRQVLRLGQCTGVYPTKILLWAGPYKQRNSYSGDLYHSLKILRWIIEAKTPLWRYWRRCCWFLHSQLEPSPVSDSHGIPSWSACLSYR